MTIDGSLAKSIQIAMRYAEAGHACGVLSPSPQTLDEWKALMTNAALGEQLHLRDGEQLASFIKRGIELVFQCLAEELGSVEMTEDTAAGVPFQLATKCNELLAAWAGLTAEWAKK